MDYDFTNLVNNVIIPQTEPNDIIGIEYLKSVVTWFYLPYSRIDDLIISYRSGAFRCIILLEGLIFVGTGSSKIKDKQYVERNIERLKAHEGFA
jgi:hypothetical protein